jgi:ligand-binding sensor domain-containing protein
MNRLFSCLGLAMFLFLISCSTEPEPVLDIPETEENVTEEPESEEEDNDSSDDNSDNGASDEESEDNTDTSGTVTWAVYTTENSQIPSNRISDIEFESNGDIWLATWYNSDAKGLLHFDGSNWIHYNTENSGLADNRLIDIAIDEADAKWIATWQDGLNWHKGTEWMHYGADNSGLPTDELTCIAIDRDQNIWIGSEEGLIKYKGGQWTVYNKDNSPLTSNVVGAISIDENNVVWITTEQEIASINSGNFKVFGYPNNLPNQNSSITFRNNEVWFVAGYGIGSLINEKFTFYDYFEDNTCLTDCQIREVHFRNDVLWLANGTECSSGGIQNFNDCELYTTENSELADDYIHTFKFDSDGNAWIGTNRGLVVMKFE